MTANRSQLSVSNVHPSAIVDARVELADDVTIGPGCVLQGPIRIDAGTHLVANVFIQGPVELGRNNTLYPGACIGYAPQDRKFDPDTPGAGVIIGDANVLREGVTVHRATGDRPTRLGNQNYLMVNTHVGHDSTLANHCTMVNGSCTGGHVQLHDHALLGGNAGVHQFCRVGRMAMIAGNEGISRDLPPFLICHHTRRVGALNIVGLRRAGLRRHIRPLKEAFDILYRQQHTRPVALDRIERQLGDDPLCRELVQFVRQSQRGITSYGSSRELQSPET